MGLYAAATIVTAIYPLVFWLPGNWTVHHAVSSVSKQNTGLRIYLKQRFAVILQMTLTAIIIVQFQKIPKPKVNGNFKGEEGFKSTIF